MSLIKFKTKLKDYLKYKKNKPIIIGVILLLIVFFSTIFALVNVNNEKILNNICIMSIDVGNLTQEEAKNKLEKLLNEKINKKIILKKDNFETFIYGNQFELEFDINSAIKKAFSIGRSGNIITNNYTILITKIFGKDINCNIKLNNELLDKKILEISSNLPERFIDNSYYIEENNLIIVKGKKGVQIETEKLEQKILENIRNINIVDDIIDIPTKISVPEEIDLNEIKKEIYQEAKNAYVSKDPVEVHAEIEGRDLSITVEEGTKIIKNTEKSCKIPLKITKPEITLKEIGSEAFPNKIASFSTRFSILNKNRKNNIELASNKIDGVILKPGEIFSFNKVVGERTSEKGYKKAGAYIGGEVVQDVGGGICQVSTTLYNAALLANLEIIERSNHQFLTSYIEAGRDATVSWGGLDLKFKNTRKYPIKIDVETKNGTCNVIIYGIHEENEYEVVINTDVKSNIPYVTKYINDNNLKEGTEVVEQKGYDGCLCETFKIIMKKGKIISKTLLSRDSYDPMAEIIRKKNK